MERKTGPGEMRLIELERGQDMREILRGLADQGYDQVQMANDLGVSVSAVNRWLKKFEARRRYVVPSAQ